MSNGSKLIKTRKVPSLSDKNPIIDRDSCYEKGPVHELYVKCLLTNEQNNYFITYKIL